MSERGSLKIYTLGDLHILRDGEPVKSLRSRKAQALLVYLACTAKSHAREVLAGLFWSESPSSRAMSNLRDVTHALRTSVEPYLAITRYSIALNPEAKVWVDVAELDGTLAALREGGETIRKDITRKAEAALALYQKDFLEGFYLRGAQGFEEWLGVERERIRLATLDAYILLVKHLGTESNYRKGIHYARRALELEPLMEVGHQQLMRMLALSGRTSEALLQYENCRQVLQKELGVEPSEETQALYESLLKGEKLPGAHTKRAPHNLQLPLSNLIGRDEELTQIAAQLEDPKCRLLTLIGVGGIGKTQLGLHTAAEVIDRYPDGVWLVELAAFGEVEMLADEIAAVFGVSSQEAKSGIGVTKILIDYLTDKTLLLVLDNCEHLIEACASFADKLLSGCPKVKILATSREAFGIKEERLYQVSPLSLPPQKVSLNGDEIEKYPAIQLFIERAATAQPGFQLNEDNRPVLAEICWQLEGIPLAIELAAARVKVISLEQIADRLQDRFRLLTGGPRTALPRHQTLQATMDWSYGLLPELEQALLRRLSVFSGGMTLKAAEEVVSFGEVEKQGILDLLSNLVDKSLVLVEDQGARVRYGMLETVRQYGQQMLYEEGEVEEARRRHANFFVQLAERADEGLRDIRQVESMNLLEAEHDNLRGALRWATDNGETDLAFRLVGALGWFWFLGGYWKESWRWFQISNEMAPGSDPVIRAKAICRAVGLEIIRGNLIGTVELVEEAIDICREAGHKEGLAWSLNLMGQAKTWSNAEMDQALPYLSESVDLFNELGNDWGIGLGKRYIGQVVEFQGEYERGINLQKEGVENFDRVGDAWNGAHSLFLLGGSATRNNDYALAEWAYEQSLVKCSIIEDKVMEAHALRGLAQLALQKGDRTHVEELFREALEIFQKIGDENCAAAALRGLGEVAQRKEDFTQAAELLGQSLLLYKRLGVDDLVIWLIDRFASLAIAMGKGERAARLLGASKDLDADSEQLFPPHYKEERNRLTAMIRMAVGSTDFEKSFKKGAAMRLEEAVMYALEESGEIELD